MRTRSLDDRYGRSPGLYFRISVKPGLQCSLERRCSKQISAGGHFRFVRCVRPGTPQSIASGMVGLSSDVCRESLASPPQSDRRDPGPTIRLTREAGIAREFWRGPASGGFHPQVIVVVLASSTCRRMPAGRAQSGDARSRSVGSSATTRRTSLGRKGFSITGRPLSVTNLRQPEASVSPVTNTTRRTCPGQRRSIS